MNKKVLLLNSTYEILAFVSDRKALKLLVKGKVDIISNWPDEKLYYGSGYMYFPATLKLKYFVKKNYAKLIFSRKSVFKRDKFTCQYCGEVLKSGQVTVDHIIPKSIGGLSSFTNCTTSCYKCNNKKGSRTPEQANMTLMSKPDTPAGYIHHVSDNDHWHDDWDNFFGLDKKSGLK